MTPQNPLPDRDHSITLSEADHFTKTGLILFGARWKAPLARILEDGMHDLEQWWAYACKGEAYRP